MNKHSTSIRPIEQQIMKIANVFGLDPSHALKFSENLPSLLFEDPYRGWYALPKFFAIVLKNFTPTFNLDMPYTDMYYCQSLDLIDLEIQKRRFFTNELQGKIDPDHFKQNHHTKGSLEYIQKEQPGDILIVECQLGMVNKFKSVQNVRESLPKKEFCLTLFQVLCIVITHPELLSDKRNLAIDCAGDHLSPYKYKKDYVFSHVPSVYCDDKQLRLIQRDIVFQSEKSGVATGFVQRN